MNNINDISSSPAVEPLEHVEQLNESVLNTDMMESRVNTRDIIDIPMQPACPTPSESPNINNFQQVMSPSRSYGQESMASALNIRGPQWQLPKFSAPAMTYQSYKLLLTGFLQLQFNTQLMRPPTHETLPSKLKIF
jgi:hypothetical protein